MVASRPSSLKQSQQAWRSIDDAIVEPDKKLSELTARLVSEVGTAQPIEPNRQQKLSNNAVLLSQGILAALIGEVGTRERMPRNFRNPAAFASRLGLNPDNRVTGRKVLSGIPSAAADEGTI